MAKGELDSGSAEIDAKQAISIAKTHVREIFSDEGGSSPTLEEIWYDDFGRVWCVTLGIRHRFETVERFTLEQRRVVDYKTVRISAETGKVLSVKLHESAT